MKKAEASFQFLITGIIAVFVLGIIFLNPYFVDFIANKFPNIIPWYNSTVEPAKIPELLRYSIATDRISYYDGLSWYELPSDNPEQWSAKTKIGTKEITHNQARYNFANYYYESSRSLEVEKRVISLFENKEFQRSISQWYLQADTWKLISSAAPFDAIIRKFNDGEPFGIIEIDLISHNYLVEERQKQTGLSIGPASGTQNLEIKNIHYVYSKGVKTGVFITDPAGIFSVYYDGKVFAHIFGQDTTKYEVDKTIKEIGYMQKDKTGKYLIYINRKNLHPINEKLSMFDRIWGRDQITQEDYETASELLSGNYYLEDLKAEYSKNEIQDKKIYGKFYLTPTDELTFDKISADLIFLENKPSPPINSNDIIYKSIVPSTLVWRDSILVKPLCFCFAQDNCQSLKVEKLPADKQMFLLVDLNAPQGPCTQTK